MKKMYNMYYTQLYKLASNIAIPMVIKDINNATKYVLSFIIIENQCFYLLNITIGKYCKIVILYFPGNIFRISELFFRKFEL